MLGLDGMVFDDGVVMRLADDRFFVTTTTGGAANVLDRFEEWLQTEWPDLRVYCTSVTEQWATVAVNGPRARDVLGRAGDRRDLDAEAFPFMTVARRHGGRHARARRPRELHRRARVRDQRGGLARPSDVGGRDGGRRTLRRHAVRHRGDARAACREGVRDRGPGHRRHGDARTTWACRGSCARTTRTSSAGDRCRGPTRCDPDRKQLVACCRSIPKPWLPEGAQTGGPRRSAAGAAGAHARPRDVELPQRRTLGRTFALAMVAGGAHSAAPPSWRRCRAATDRSRGHRAGLLRRRGTKRPGRHRWSVTTARDPLARDALTTSPASRRSPTAASVLEHVPFLAQVNLRLDPTLAGRAPYPVAASSRTPPGRTARGRPCGSAPTSG